MMSGDTRQRVLWILWTLMFVASLGAVVALNRSTPAAALGGLPTDGEARARVSPGGIRPKRLGIEFVHQAPTFDARLEHIMPQIAAMGAAVAVADFDRDGWQDFYVTNSAEGGCNRLYRNKGDGTFADVAPELGLADVNRAGTGVSMGALWGDFDNDGYRGSLSLQVRPARALQQRWRTGVRSRVRARRPAGVGQCQRGHLVGLRRRRMARSVPLGLLAGGHRSLASEDDPHHAGELRVRRERRPQVRVPQSWRRHVRRDVGCARHPVPPLDAGRGCRRSVRHRVSRISSSPTTTASPSSTPIRAASDSSRWGAKPASADAEERHERVVRRHLQRRPPVDLQDQHLRAWRARAGERSLGAEGACGRRGRSNSRTSRRAMGVDLGGWSWGAQFGDLNNDGTLDMYLVNGYVSAGERTSYWYDFAEIAVGHSAHHRRRQQLAADARAQPVGLSAQARLDQRRRRTLHARWRRTSARPTPTTAARSRWRISRTAARSTSSSPISAGPLLVYTNTVSPGRHWIAFELEGTVSNRSAIGARVEVQWNGRRQVQEVSGGSGFSAQNQRRLHYGLGSATGVDRVVIRWPSGTHSDDRPARDRSCASREGTSMSTDTTVASRVPATLGWRQALMKLDNRLLPPVLITCILITAHLNVRHPRSLRAHRPRHHHRHCRRARAGPHYLRQVAAPGERLHLGDQRRHSRQVAVPVAVFLRQPDFDPVQVRAAAERPAFVEPVEPRRERRAVPGAADSLAPQHPMGQQPVADGRDLAARIRRSSGASAACTSAPPTSRRSWCSRWCAAPSPATRGRRRWRRSPARCISSSFSSW